MIGKLSYRESIEDSAQYKKDYMNGLEALVRARQAEAAQKREEYAKGIFSEQDRYRQDFKKMLGWPLVDCEVSSLPGVKKTKLSEEKGYTVYRMQFEILDGVVMTGLYFRMSTDEKKPLVLVQHGGNGTPELVSGVYDSTGNYNQMLQRVIDHGVHAFAPQLLLWHPERYGVPQSRVSIDARLKRVGSSITAVELFGLTRILDYFEAVENVSSFGMVGLSYGGFYTLFFSALDTRIRSAISCSFFNERDRYPWSDWTWFRSAEQFDDAEIACMVYPRRLCIEIGTKDELFDVSHGIRSYEKIKNLCKDVGLDWISFIAFDGTHEFYKDERPVEELMKHLFSGI
ncbi:MAG: hypothetical protein IKB34_00460 [Clostridia bacterium]|nr:hypothetical protein [Clostridia bacterium]